MHGEDFVSLLQQNASMLPMTSSNSSDSGNEDLPVTIHLEWLNWQILKPGDALISSPSKPIMNESCLYRLLCIQSKTLSSSFIS